MALVDMFLKLDGVDGECQDSEHKNEIQIEGYRLSGLSSRDAFTNQSTGAVRISHLTIHAKVDKSTPKLFEKLKRNDKIPTATLTCRKAGKEQFKYFEVVLSEVLVARIQIGGLEGGDVLPACEFDLAYGKLTITAWTQTSLGTMSGAVVFNYNLQTNA